LAKRKKPTQIPAMDSYRQKIKALIDAKPGATMKSASLAIPMNHAYIKQFLYDGKPRVLKEEVRIALAKYLGVDQNQLRPNVTEENENLNIPESSPLQHLPYGPLGERDLPLMGEIVAGDSGEFSLNGTANEYVARPNQLKAVVKAYAVYIVGDSMEPVAYNGQVAYVNPNRPPTPRGLVVVELADGKAFIKTLVRRKADVVVLRQYNPPKDFEIPQSQIAKLHRIVLHGDPA
jgi:phage repressor protein C with HTH and peptisase S24 domain